ncbi:MAG: phage portal protein [PVC group bacterium]|nr:phage portal protein [PVC group bacterium]
MIVNFNPSQKQYLGIKLLLDNITEFLAFGGGADGGKSWLGCFWLYYMCKVYPGTRWFIGRQELKRLKTSTLLTFFKMCNFYKIPQSEYNYVTDSHIQVGISRIDLLDLKYLPSDPLYERFGSLEFTGGFIEEGGEIHFDAFDTLKSRIGRQLNTHYNILGKIFVTCNPKRNWLYEYFYKPVSNNILPTNYAFIQALVGDNPYREKGRIDKLKGITNKAKRERLLLGNWNYEDEPDQLINYEWLDNAQSVLHLKGKHTGGSDIARYGDDKSIISIMDGNALINLFEYEGLSTDKMADKIQEKINEFTIDADLFGVDGVGLGAGTVDALHRRDINIVDIVSGERAVEMADNGQYAFFNLRSQMWWMMREELRTGAIAIKIHNDKLFEDLTAPKYEIVGDRTIKVESKDSIKKRIGRSTDYGDAFVYNNWVRKQRHVKYIKEAVAVENPFW